MISVKEMLLAQLGTGEYLFDKFTSDLSDAEYFKVPAANTNHVAWNIGHIATSEDSMVAAVTGGSMKFSQDLHKMFGGSSECFEDAAKYPSRGEIDEMRQNARANAIEQIKMFDEAKWNDPAPQGWPTDLFPTLGSVWALLATHQFWHIGQITVCRQTLGKSRVLGMG